jgi:hypothetical protein
VLGNTVTAHIRMHSFLFGPRWRSASGNARGFAQVLVGGERDSGSATATVGGVTESGGASETNVAIAPGAGVDIMLSRNTGLRLGANFRLVNHENEWGKVFQFVAGVVWGRN